MFIANKVERKTNKFDWAPDNITTEKSILILIWVTIFLRFQPYYMLDIVPKSNPVQYQGKTNDSNLRTW